MKRKQSEIAQIHIVVNKKIADKFKEIANQKKTTETEIFIKMINHYYNNLNYKSDYEEKIEIANRKEKNELAKKTQEMIEKSEIERLLDNFETAREWSDKEEETKALKELEKHDTKKVEAVKSYFYEERAKRKKLEAETHELYRKNTQNGTKKGNISNNDIKEIMAEYEKK